MEALSRTTLPKLPPEMRAPTYDATRLETGIVHLGVGAFHRAHQAVYTEDVIQSGDMRWGILGASLRSAETRDALQGQDWLYTLAENSQSGTRLRVIGVLKGLFVAPENPAALVEAMSQPGVKLVSLTVTEKGYCHDPANGELNEKPPRHPSRSCKPFNAALSTWPHHARVEFAKAAKPRAVHGAVLR